MAAKQDQHGNENALTNLGLDKKNVLITGAAGLYREHALALEGRGNVVATDISNKELNKVKKDLQKKISLEP